MDVETIETFRYRTSDNKVFDERKKAFWHEREQALYAALASTVMSDGDRKKFVGLILEKFDTIYDRFEELNVLIYEDD